MMTVKQWKRLPRVVVQYPGFFLGGEDGREGRFKTSLDKALRADPALSRRLDYRPP